MFPIIKLKAHVSPYSSYASVDSSHRLMSACSSIYPIPLTGQPVLIYNRFENLGHINTSNFNLLLYLFK